MNDAASSAAPENAAVRQDDLVELYRRVCRLRARGDEAAAGRLESSELAGSLAEATAAGRITPELWRRLAGREDERLADAKILAELLGPMLVRGGPPAALRREAPRPPRSDSAVPAIADLIEDMLRQDRRESRAARLS